MFAGKHRGVENRSIRGLDKGDRTDLKIVEIETLIEWRLVATAFLPLLLFDEIMDAAAPGQVLFTQL